MGNLEVIYKFKVRPERPTGIPSAGIDGFLNHNGKRLHHQGGFEGSP